MKSVYFLAQVILYDEKILIISNTINHAKIINDMIRIIIYYD